MNYFNQFTKIFAVISWRESWLWSSKGQALLAGFPLKVVVCGRYLTFQDLITFFIYKIELGNILHSIVLRVYELESSLQVLDTIISLSLNADI